MLRPQTGSSHALVYLFDYEHEKKQKAKGTNLKYSIKLREAEGYNSIFYALLVGKVSALASAPATK